MELLSHTLLLCLNAPEHPSALALTLATIFAEQLIWGGASDRYRMAAWQRRHPQGHARRNRIGGRWAF